MAKLNPNAQKWVDALRSGKYKQGRSCLAVDNTFCCLGVLCEVAIESGLPIEKQVPGVGSPNIYDREEDYLPQQVMDWVGLKTVSGAFEETSLASRNDGGDDFRHIADLIEAHAEELGVAAHA